MHLYQIGEFSRLSHVPLKTLRYYDEIGLFTPVEVDPVNGYRRYTAAQLPRLNRLLALRALGFTLEQIGAVLADDLTSDQLRGMLILRRAELEQERADAEAKLVEVEIRLRHIELENVMPDVDVITKPLEPLTIVGARELVPTSEQMRERCMHLDSLVCRFVERHGLKVVGPSFALYYPAEEAIDVEMAYAIAAPTSAVGSEAQAPVGVHELPAATAATAIYHGSYDDFGAVGRLHVALREWLATRQRQLVGPVREIYVSPRPGPDGVMELQYPIEPRP
jgi:DNA-binding transcriptional MerR regulator